MCGRFTRATEARQFTDLIEGLTFSNIKLAPRFSIAPDFDIEKLKACDIFRANHRVKKLRRKMLKNKAITFVIIAALSSPCMAVSKAHNPRFEGCREKLKAAQKLEILYDMSWDGKSEPRIIVGPTFMDIAIDAKEGLASTVNCFLMVGDESKCVNFDLLHWQTGKAVGRFSYCAYKPE